MTEQDSQGSENNIARLEALLFTHGEPLKKLKMEKVLEVTKEECATLLQTLAQKLQAEDRGLTLLVTAEEVQLVTKPQFGDLLLSFLKEELTEELTPASLEALSLIAYGGPLSRARLDFLRGVNSSFTLRTLRLRGLIDRVADLEFSHSFVYDVTPECMRYLGVTRREELPRFEEFRNHLQSAAQNLVSENSA